MTIQLVSLVKNHDILMLQKMIINLRLKEKDNVKNDVIKVNGDNTYMHTYTHSYLH